MSGEEKMSTPWVVTASGGAVDIVWPKSDQIKLGDIAQSLSRIQRFNGHTTVPVSVAQHSLLVEALIADDDYELRLAALLHDAHEAYLGDISSPMKRAIRAVEQDSTERKTSAGHAVSILEMRFDQAIHPVFGLPATLPGEWVSKIRAADLMALALEKERFTVHCSRDWGIAFPVIPDVLPLDAENLLEEISGPAAKVMFVQRVRDLIALRHGVVF